jgi:DNA-binding CsgD family transcriptional regulator
MTAGLPLIDHGLGVAGLRGLKPPMPGPINVTDMHIASGPPDFPTRHMAAMSEFPPEQLHRETVHGNVSTMSEQTAANPWMLEVWTRYVDYAKDRPGITAMDPDGHGVHIMAPLPRVTQISAGTRKRWQMLGAHLSAGYRLRRALRKRRETTHAASKLELPLGADAVLALPNPPQVSDPRGLSAREEQVVAYALLGESHKLIAYRLGWSGSTVTRALGSAMRKLGVSTQAELIAKLRAAAGQTNGG